MKGCNHRVHISCVVSGCVMGVSVGNISMVNISVVSSNDMFIVGSIFGCVMVSSMDDVSEVVAMVFSGNVSFARMVKLVLICGVVAPLFMVRSLIQVV